MKKAPRHCSVAHCRPLSAHSRVNTSNLLPTEQCTAIIPHVPTNYRGYGEALRGENPDPHQHQMVVLRKITPLVIEHQPHRLIDLPPRPDEHLRRAARGSGEQRRWPPPLRPGGLLGGAPHQRHRMVRCLLDQVPGG
jgi:hypothetical protein